jgi:hypothetical protein
MSLTDRVAAEQARREGRPWPPLPEPFQPAWVRRAQEHRLPAQVSSSGPGLYAIGIIRHKS